MSCLVKPNNWVIPQEIIALNGITNEIANEKGISEKEATEQFMALWARCDLRVSHNTTFDNRIIRIALKRHLPDLVTDEIWKDKKGYYCTLINFRKLIGGKSGHTLSEAYEYFTKKKLEGAHRAMADVEACLEVYFSMSNREKDGE